MSQIPTELATKKARNEAARIYATLKWKVKIATLSHADLVGFINDAIIETREKVKVDEIRDEAIKRYESMIEQVNIVANQPKPRFQLPDDDGK